MTVDPFRLFEGKAEEAMNFYVSRIPNSRVLGITRYGPGQAGAEGSVAMAAFTLNGQRIMCTDSVMKHPFTFTPSISFFITCDNEEQIRTLAVDLASGGSELMPLGNYGFSRQFTWVSDRYGISWQLNLD